MATHDSPIPTTIGRYQVQALIGRGGMGEVYKAFDPRLDRVVALKTIRASSDSDGPVLLDRLYREARACGQIQRRERCGEPAALPQPAVGRVHEQHGEKMCPHVEDERSRFRVDARLAQRERIRDEVPHQSDAAARGGQDN